MGKEYQGFAKGLFSGALRPGLIEASAAASADGMSVGFSGALRPGLIEATGLCLFWLMTWAAFSGALRPGLIEAIEDGLAVMKGFRVFRGFTPRPH